MDRRIWTFLAIVRIWRHSGSCSRGGFESCGRWTSRISGWFFNRWMSTSHVAGAHCFITICCKFKHHASKSLWQRLRTGFRMPWSPFQMVKRGWCGWRRNISRCIANFVPLLVRWPTGLNTPEFLCMDHFSRMEFWIQNVIMVEYSKIPEFLYHGFPWFIIIFPRMPALGAILSRSPLATNYSLLVSIPAYPMLFSTKIPWFLPWLPLVN